MKKLIFVICTICGVLTSPFLTSCEPERLPEIEEQGLTEGEDGEIEEEEDDEDN